MFRLYDFECVECNIKEERIVKDTETPVCRSCGSVMRKLPPIVGINMGVGPYGRYDETLGTYVSTNKQWREECRKQDVTPKGDTPKHGEVWV